MTHFGIICPDGAGHFNPMSALAQELQQRGHRVTLIGKVDVRASAVGAGLGFAAIGESAFPLGSVAKMFHQRGELSGLAALRATLAFVEQETRVMFQEAPAAIQSAGIEALLVDQCTPAGGTIADFLNIPFITICNALLMNWEMGVPPLFVPWHYHPTALAYCRNQIGYFLGRILTQRVQKLQAEYRQHWQLPPYLKQGDSYSALAQLSQQPPEFEFPRQKLPPWFHFTGPYSTVRRSAVPFPWEKLTGQPLIFASMGTIQNRLIHVFQTIATACQGLDAQLVISLGSSTEAENLANLPGNPIVVKYAPQLELLQKATLTITHAGLNTVLESLANAVPMVAIPITNDQPGVSARIAWTGTGEVVLPQHLAVTKLQAAIYNVLQNPTYRQNTARLQAAILKSGGVKQAADIIETAIATGKPVLAPFNSVASRETYQ